MRAYWINAADRTVEEVEQGGLADLRRLVGGSIEVAKGWPSGDVLFADDEGLVKGPPSAFFRISGKDFPVAGNGVVCGTDGEGDSVAPAMALEALRAEVSFPSLGEVAAWARANRDVPSSTFTAEGEAPVVLGTVGDLYGDALGGLGDMTREQAAEAFRRLVGLHGLRWTPDKVPRSAWDELERINEVLDADGRRRALGLGGG